MQPRTVLKSDERDQNIYTNLETFPTQLNSFDWVELIAKDYEYF